MVRVGVADDYSVELVQAYVQLQVRQRPRAGLQPGGEVPARAGGSRCRLRRAPGSSRLCRARSARTHRRPPGAASSPLTGDAWFIASSTFADQGRLPVLGLVKLRTEQVLAQPDKCTGLTRRDPTCCEPAEVVRLRRPVSERMLRTSNAVSSAELTRTTSGPITSPIMRAR